MKKLTFIIVLLFTLLFFSPVEVNAQKNPLNFRKVEGIVCDPTEATFYGPAQGIIICKNGKIFTSQDSGATWQQKDINSSEIFNSISVQHNESEGDTANVTIVGNSGLIERSTDSGNTWSEVESGTTNNLRKVTYGCSPATKQSWAYAVGDNSTVLYSDDGGKTWKKQTTIYQFDHFYDAFFINNEIGWIVGSNGIMYRTFNSGGSWNYVEGDHSNPNYYGIAFSSALVGYVVGSGGFIGYTSDGGNSWTKQNSNATEQINSIDFGGGAPDSMEVPIAVGDNGLVVTDSDKNGTWEKIDIGTSSKLTDVTTDTKGYIWIFGENGVVYTTRPLVTKPNAPSDLKVSLVSSGQINLSWLDNSDNENGFIIEKKEGLNGQWADGDTVNINSYEDKELNPNTQYSYRVSAFNSAGESSFTNEVTAKTLNTIPKAPSNLTAITKSSTQIDLSWKDNSSNENAFILERREGSNGSWVEGDTVGMNQVYCEDKELKPNTDYYYRISSYNAVGKSVFSNEVSAKTYDAAPLAPTELKATVVGGSQIDLSWYDNASNETGYKVERRTGQNPFAEIFTLNTNATVYSDKNLDDGTKYTYRVAAYNSINRSGYSNESSATTILNSPTDLTLKKNSSGFAQLDWKDNSKSESGFTIEKKIDNGSFGKLIDIAANSIIYSDVQVNVGQHLTYRVQAFNSIITSSYSNTAEIVITGVETENSIPTEYSLKQNFPNPFNPETVIKYDLPKGGYVSLKIYDILGCEILTLVNAYQDAGSYELKCSANQLSTVSGLYLYKLTANGYSSVKKMLLLK